jgi:hypothetical protein
MAWRRYLIEIPARITEVASVWYRLYWIVVMCLAALIGPALVIAVLVLYFGFGIRWGW